MVRERTGRICGSGPDFWACLRIFGHWPRRPGGEGLGPRFPSNCAAWGGCALAGPAEAVDSGIVGRGRTHTMTQPLRRSHFRTWILLPAFLIALFAAGLIVRRSTMPANAHI